MIQCAGFQLEPNSSLATKSCNKVANIQWPALTSPLGSKLQIRNQQRLPMEQLTMKELGLIKKKIAFKRI